MWDVSFSAGILEILPPRIVTRSVILTRRRGMNSLQSEFKVRPIACVEPWPGTDKHRNTFVRLNTLARSAESADHPGAMAAAKKIQKKSDEGVDRQIVCQNRRARHDYDILDELDCGIVLSGSEVKSIRNNKISIEEAWVHVDNGEVWMLNCDIAEYAQASIYNHSRQRKRKLLLKRREIHKFAETGENDGLTLIPLAVFFQRGLVKIRLGLCKGRKLHDKRQKLREQDAQREMRDAKVRR